MFEQRLIDANLNPFQPQGERGVFSQQEFDYTSFNIFEASAISEGEDFSLTCFGEATSLSHSCCEKTWEKALEKSEGTTELSEDHNTEESLQNFSIKLESWGNLKGRKKGRRPTDLGLTKRKDIVLKTLVRKIRKFHTRKLKSVTKFMSRKRCSQYLLRKFLKEYIEKEFCMEPSEGFIKTLDKFLFLHPVRNNIFRETLYEYSLPKLEKCMEDQYFRSLAYHFFFEADSQELDDNTKIGIELMKRAEDFKDLSEE